MIIAAIIALAAVVFVAISAALGAGLPTMPSELVGIINQGLTLCRDGFGLFWVFVDPSPVKVMVTSLIAAEVVEKGYTAVMWVAKKIPMFGVE